MATLLNTANKLFKAVQIISYITSQKKTYSRVEIELNNSEDIETFFNFLQHYAAYKCTPRASELSQIKTELKADTIIKNRYSRTYPHKEKILVKGNKKNIYEVISKMDIDDYQYFELSIQEDQVLVNEHLPYAKFGNLFTINDINAHLYLVYKGEKDSNTDHIWGYLNNLEEAIANFRSNSDNAFTELTSLIDTYEKKQFFQKNLSIIYLILADFNFYNKKDNNEAFKYLKQSLAAAESNPQDQFLVNPLCYQLLDEIIYKEKDEPIGLQALELKIEQYEKRITINLNKGKKQTSYTLLIEANNFLENIKCDNDHIKLKIKNCLGFIKPHLQQFLISTAETFDDQHLLIKAFNHKYYGVSTSIIEFDLKHLAKNKNLQNLNYSKANWVNILDKLMSLNTVPLEPIIIGLMAYQDQLTKNDEHFIKTEFDTLKRKFNNLLFKLYNSSSYDIAPLLISNTCCPEIETVKSFKNKYSLNFIPLEEQDVNEFQKAINARIELNNLNDKEIKSLLDMIVFYCQHDANNFFHFEFALKLFLNMLKNSGLSLLATAVSPLLSAAFFHPQTRTVQDLISPFNDLLNIIANQIFDLDVKNIFKLFQVFVGKDTFERVEDKDIFAEFDQKIIDLFINKLDSFVNMANKEILDDHETVFLIKKIIATQTISSSGNLFKQITIYIFETASKMKVTRDLETGVKNDKYFDGLRNKVDSNEDNPAERTFYYQHLRETRLSKKKKSSFTFFLTEAILNKSPQDIYNDLCDKAGNGSYTAMLELAECHRYGYGTSPNLFEACWWYFCAGIKDIKGDQFLLLAKKKLSEITNPEVKFTVDLYTYLLGDQNKLQELSESTIITNSNLLQKIQNDILNNNQVLDIIKINLCQKLLNIYTESVINSESPLSPLFTNIIAQNNKLKERYPSFYKKNENYSPIELNYPLLHSDANENANEEDTKKPLSYNYQDLRAFSHPAVTNTSNAINLSNIASNDEEFSALNRKIVSLEAELTNAKGRIEQLEKSKRNEAPQDINPTLTIQTIQLYFQQAIASEVQKIKTEMEGKIQGLQSTIQELETTIESQAAQISKLQSNDYRFKFSNQKTKTELDEEQTKQESREFLPN